MKKLLWIILVISLMAPSAFPQSNKIVFGPRVGDDAGVLRVHNGENIGIELWVRTDPDNPAYIAAVIHPLMSEDYIIAIRNGVEMDPDYAWRAWDVWLEGPYIHNPDDNFPIPEDHTVEIHCGMVTPFDPFPWDFLNTEGEWDCYGCFLMTCNIDIPTEHQFYPFAEGWYPHDGQGTLWAFNWPPGGSIVPEQSYCGLYVESNVCSYVPGDCDHNGTPLELNDVLAMIGFYRGTIEPYLCECGEDPPVYNFAATADPNGNCIPNELNDAVTEIAAYRGTMTASGCPDCPGSGPLLIGENKAR